MGDGTRGCKRSAEAAEMEASSTSFSLPKKTKPVHSRELQELELTSPDIEFEKPPDLSNSQDKLITVATSLNSVGVLVRDTCSSLCSSSESSASRCSSNESCDIVKDSLRFVDLEAKSFETDISTCINTNEFRETTPLSERCRDSEEMESPEKKPSSSPSPSPPRQPKMPSQEEIDDFFSAAEKNEQKRFAEKYNYDIVKDVPLDGRYQWIRLKP